MARTYNDLVDLVRRWSNRDEEVLSNSIISDSLRYAADKCYRVLRVPPLEATANYSSTELTAGTTNTNNGFSSVTEVQIPIDLIEFIQIREYDANDRTVRVFNEKTDVRTFNDLYAEKYNASAFWTRYENCIQLAPGFGSTTFRGGTAAGLELYYYRRLPALNARYQVNAINYTSGELTTTAPTLLRPMATDAVPTATGVDLFFPMGTTLEEANNRVNSSGTALTPSLSATDTNTVSFSFYGNEVPNWLRDENERVLLMGALAECFFYLQEDEQATKFAQLFGAEIQELNTEDVNRNASGGNVQMNFNGRGLI